MALMFISVAQNKANCDTSLTQQTRDIHPMLFQCWANIEDGGPTLEQHGVNVLCLLGRRPYINMYTALYTCQYIYNQ